MIFKQITLRLLAIPMFVTIMLTACRTSLNNISNISKVNYQEAKNYFLADKNTKEVPLKITSQSQLEKHFGMAAFMGKGGEVTIVDFKKYFIIPIVLEETDIRTDIVTPILKGNEKQLHLHYNIKEGEKMSFKIQPIKLLMVDKRYKNAELVVSAVR